jgi:hypothetical protein
LEFLIPDPKGHSPNLIIEIDGFQTASATVSLASFAYDGPVTDALWAVDFAHARLANEDSETGSANLFAEFGFEMFGHGQSGFLLGGEHAGNCMREPRGCSVPAVAGRDETPLGNRPQQSGAAA